MNFTPEIFQAFQTKLKVGNRRTIHLNAIPGNSRYKFDISRLSNIHKSLPEHFILDLLTLRSLNFKFSIHDKPQKETILKTKENDIYLNEYEDFKPKTKENKTALDNEVIERTLQLQKIATSLENLIFQNEVIQSEKGLNSLGFGFPLLVRRDMKDGQISVAPILIWSVKIKPSIEMNTWEVTRTEDDPIYLNEVLINHLQTDSGVFLEPIPTEMLEDGKIDKPELFTICNTILKQLHVDQNLDFILNNYKAILPIKSKATYEKMLPQKGDAFIEKCGIFSLFEVQKQNIINDYSDLIANFKTDENPNSVKDFQSITTIETDPSQQNILETLKTKSNIVIQGPPGTGKSQTLTALLINALENKQKTIVVCEKQTALEVLEAAMQTSKLGHFCMMIKDGVTDRKIVVDAVRNIVDNTQFKKTKEVYPISLLQEQLKEIKNSKNQINAIHHKLNEPLLNNQNWTEIIGQILACTPFKEELDLKSIAFKFNTEEWNNTIALIEKGQSLFNSFKPYKENPFYNFEKVIKTNSFESQIQANEDFKNYKSDWETILQTIQDYEQHYFSKRKEEFASQLEILKQNRNKVFVITATLNQTNDEFNNSKANSFVYKFTSWFSKSKKNVLKNREALQELAQNIKSISLHRNFYPIELSDDLWQNLLEIRAYEEKINSANQSLIQKIESDFRTIDFLNFFEKNYQNNKSDLVTEKSKKLIEKIKNDEWILNWKNSNSFQEFKITLEEAFTQHEALKSNQENPFSIIHNWYSFFTSLSNSQKQIIEKLYSVSNWTVTFTHEYLDLLLKENTNNDLNFNEINYNSILKKIKLFSSSQKDFIDSYWKNEQLKAVQKFENLNKEITVANLYNKRKSVKFNRLTLRQIVNKDIDLFTSFFPVLFITPDVCSNLFQGKNYYFDNVVFDEASQLKLEDNLPALLKAKNIIIAGDEHQMPPSNYFSKVFDGTLEDEDELEEETIISQKNALLNIESLLDFALENNFEKNHLDFHYRSKHPYLIDFSNHAFYNARLKPLPALVSHKPIEFFEVDGVFDEHINKEEANKVIEILEKIAPDENGKYPSVGIATFNITQRNYIKRLISYKQSLEQNAAFREQIINLEAAGLFIKNLENIQGDERDIIIISTTYGKKESGKFIQSFGPINHTKGYKLLNVIITRAKEKIYICNSIPVEIYTNYKEALSKEGSNNRKAVFYAYLAYCKAISDENDSKRNEILQDLNQFSHNERALKNNPKDLFKEQVYKTFKNSFSEIKINLDEPFGGYNIDLLIESEKSKPIAIECLSNYNYKNDLAYLEDLHKEKILKKAGYNYQRIWSHHWWENSEREILKWKKIIAEN